MVAVCVVLIMAIVVAAGMLLANLRSEQIAKSDRNLQNLATLLAEQIDRSFQSIELVQTGVIERIRSFDVNSPAVLAQAMSGRDTYQRFRDRIEAMPYIDAIVLTTPDGGLVNFSHRWPVPRIAKINRDRAKMFATMHRDSFIGKPLRSPDTGAWVLPIVRKVTSANGTFIGIVIGAMRLSYFEKLFNSVARDQDRSIALFTRAGVLVARYPHSDRLRGRSLAQRDIFKNVLSKGRNGTVQQTSFISGKKLLISGHNLSHYPMSVVTTSRVDDVLTGWRDAVLYVTGAAGIIVLMIMAAAFLVARQIAGRLKAQNRQLDAALNNMSQGLTMFDASGHLIVCNDRYLEMFNLPPEVAKPGCTLGDLLRHRSARDTYDRYKFGEPEERAAEIIAIAAKGEAVSHEAEMKDDRILSITRQPIAGGGWVTTFDDITETRQREASFQLLFDDNPIPMMVYDLDALTIIAVNDAAIAHYGYSREQFLTLSVFEIRPPEERAGFSEFLSTYEGNHSSTQPWRHMKADGTVFDTEIYARALNYRGRRASIVAVYDITDRKQAEERLRDSQKFLDAIIESVPAAIIVKDVPAGATDAEACHYSLVNRTFEELFEVSRDQMIGKTIRDIYTKEQAEVIVAESNESLRSHAPIIVPDRLNFALNHGPRLVAGKSVAVRDDDDRPRYLLTVLEDVSERRNADEKLRQTQKFLDAIIENVPVPLIVKNVPTSDSDAAECPVSLINRAGEELLGVRRENLIGKTLDEIYSKEHADHVIAQNNAALQSKNPILIADHEIRTPGNGVRMTTSRNVAVRDDDGKPQYLLTVLEDVTDRSRVEQRISHMAHFDNLTELPNRATFNDAMEAALKHTRETGEQFAVLSLDLDGFKDANDSHGHAVGDALLRAVARRLQDAANGAFLARIGGDEFMLIVNSGKQPEASAAVAERLLRALAAEFEIEDRILTVGATIGGAIYPDNGTDAKTLMINADVALYRAKAAVRGTVLFYEAEMGEQVRERRALQADLRAATENGELFLNFQPQLTIDGDPIGFEALLRWRCPKRGLVSPDVFIPVAEESGLIVQIDEWVLRAACHEAASWPQPLTVAVNISPTQFRTGDFPGFVHAVLMETGLPAERLELEVTEGVLIDDFSRAISILCRLKALGVHIALDDFGTGYSSMSYLHSFPFDKIKIDRAFVGDLEDNRHSMAIVRAVIDLGHSLNVPILAEGVETAEQLAILKRGGCDEVQGYFTGRPRAIEEYAEMVGRRTEGAKVIRLAG
jgi:diguanylate cyclase (GGDEF)-like protein/PAS domain S-box-containing protein